jgi:hypothetical protein
MPETFAMSIDITEESILDALHKVPRDHWSRVLEFLHNLEPKAGQPSESAEPRHWTATELLALPPAERDAILEAAAAMAESDYRNDPELTAFEAYGPDDLYVDSADTETW